MGRARAGDKREPGRKRRTKPMACNAMGPLLAGRFPARLEGASFQAERA